MSGLGDSGRVVLSCPLCEAWQIDADIEAIGWPLAGTLVEEAIAEHVDDCVRERGVRMPMAVVLGPNGLEALGG